jgi:hypothetical protein
MRDRERRPLGLSCKQAHQPSDHGSKQLNPQLARSAVLVPDQGCGKSESIAWETAPDKDAFPLGRELCREPMTLKGPKTPMHGRLRESRQEYGARAMSGEA